MIRSKKGKGHDVYYTTSLNQFHLEPFSPNQNGSWSRSRNSTTITLSTVAFWITDIRSFDVFFSFFCFGLQLFVGISPLANWPANCWRVDSSFPPPHTVVAVTLRHCPSANRWCSMRRSFLVLTRGVRCVRGV